jgi:hypothetical protein
MPYANPDPKNMRIEQITKQAKDKMLVYNMLTTFCVQQGWTKFSTFGDLDALTEEEWDKVCFLHISNLSPICDVQN